MQILQSIVVSLVIKSICASLSMKLVTKRSGFHCAAKQWERQPLVRWINFSHFEPSNKALTDSSEGVYAPNSDLIPTSTISCSSVVCGSLSRPYSFDCRRDR